MVFLRPETKVKYRLEKGIATPYHQQKTYRCQENFEVLMSCIIKYTSKSIYVKYLSKSKNDIPPSKHLYSQSNSVFFCLFFSSVMKSVFPFADVAEVWIFMMTLFKGTYLLSSPQGQWNWPNDPSGWRNLHVRSFSSLFTTLINANHQNSSKQQVI